MERIEVVGAAILDGNKVLAAQRSPLMNSPLKWEFAGGKVEKGETHKQALEREIKEELGINISVKNYLAAGFSIAGNREIALYVYEARIDEGTPAAKEHACLKWVEIPRIMELDWAEADIPACKKLIDDYKCP